MLARHMLGYMPSLIIPGILSFASVFVLTHLLSPVSYGHYVLAINAMTMILGVAFLWLQSVTSRLLPQEIARGNEKRFAATLYLLYLACCIAVLSVGLFFELFAPAHDWLVVIWFAPVLAVLRAYLNINQAFHRTYVRIARYNIVEVGQAVIGLAVAVLMVMRSPHASDAAGGLLIGLAAMALYDWRMVMAAKIRDFDRAVFRDIIHFGLPFVINFGLSFVLSRSDSFLIQIFRNSAEVGIYNAGYALPDRIGQYLFMAVATASLPLTIRRLEQESTEAARAQTYDNGVAMMALAIPACMGLLLVNRLLIVTMVGPDFQAGAMQVMPLIAIATIFNGITTHYFDHAFHLAKKTRLFFFTLGPSALLNLLVNLWAIPRYGYMGAAWTTLGTYVLYMTLSILVGRSIFRIRFPFKPTAQIIAATAVMSVAVLAVHVPENALGLLVKIAVGAATYGLGIMTFNVMDIRGRIARHLARRVTEVTPSAVSVIDTPDGIEAIEAEWRALHDRAGKPLFGSYEWFQIWRRNLGQDAELQVTVSRGAAGEVKAILPLAVRRSRLMHIAEWAGYDVFDFGDALAENPADIDALWQALQQQGDYNIALIKDVHASAATLKAVAGSMALREIRHNYFLTLSAFGNGDAWLAEQSRKLRGDIRRKTEKMQAKGDTGFHVLPAGDLVPGNVIDALYAQKLAWFKANHKTGIFNRAEMKQFLHELAQQAAREETLYLAWLTCGSDIVACHMGFVRQGVLHLYLTTYDAAYGAYSPGNILMIETIKWAADQKLRELDFMRGDEAYKQRFASGTRDLSAFVAGRGWLGKVAVRLFGKAKQPPVPDDHEAQ